MRHLGFGLLCAAALGLVGIFGFAIFNQPTDPVGPTCRDTVAYAAVDVDAWRLISRDCTEREQLALLEEFEGRGLSTEALQRSRGELPAS